MKFTTLTIFLFTLLIFNSLAQKNRPVSAESTEQYPVPVTSSNQLFYIQRSSNINSIIYDANVGIDKKLNPENPVHTYWILYTQGGKKQELTSIQRSLAYGLHTRPASAEVGGSYEGYFFAYRKRKFVVKLNPKGEPIALFPINGKMQILKRVFVKVDESGMMPSVISVELWGRDTVTDKEVYEKFRP